MTPVNPTISPREFIDKWDGKDFGERQASQEMFLDVCRLVGHSTPVQFGNRDEFTFEKAVPGGSADAFLEGHFVWEFKGQDRQLNDAVTQAVGYARHLKNPPLIIVSSFETIRIETNFQGMELVRYDISLGELVQQEKFDLLNQAFHNPDSLRPTRTIDAVTQETAKIFSDIVSDMEGQSSDPEALAVHLNRVIFCLYAEDAGLLPEGLFTNILYSNRQRPDLSNRAIANLFGQMATGGLFGTQEIAYFNGDLFKGDAAIELNSNALQRLGEAVEANWRSIEPSVFGTLFERALDASKRAQTGAHYTGASDIELVVEPVVMTPLRREWEATKQEVNDLLDEDDNESGEARLGAFRDRLASVKVLDPACGSGNFLYISLKSLLDLEREVIDFAANKGWAGLTPRVQPNQMLGLEVNHYAAELARTALRIGYVQWHQANGFPYTQSPILTPLDTIRQTDAILDLTDRSNPKEPEWPEAEFIVGNPPFLGFKSFGESLNASYRSTLRRLYLNRVPKNSDLCCFWFEKARAQIEQGKTTRAGLLATQTIRSKNSRPVLESIKKSGDIFFAISDQNWSLKGASVHTSVICFDDGTETERILDGESVSQINVDLTGGTDLTVARELPENRDLAYQGVGKVGKFDISDSLAQDMLTQSNPHKRPNSDVIKRWIIGEDIAQGGHHEWIIDFGASASMDEAALYESPFEYVKANVMPTRVTNATPWRAEHWWLHGSPASTMKTKLAAIDRYIATPKVAKHRFFVWLEADVLPSNTVIAIASDDDYLFGVLSSSPHELWARRVGSQLREAESGGTYTVGDCFKKFPFPEPNEAQRRSIAAAAVELCGKRANESRTLTDLYNERPTWLDLAHKKLDEAVAEAYGWPADLSDEEILEKLLALNLERTAAQ